MQIQTDTKKRKRSCSKVQETSSFGRSMTRAFPGKPTVIVTLWPAETVSSCISTVCLTSESPQNRCPSPLADRQDYLPANVAALNLPVSSSGLMQRIFA